MDSEKLLGVEGFAPCPTCKQYSHSIGEDKLAEAFNHFQTMHAHPVRGHPMGYIFEEKTRDMAQVLMSLQNHRDPTPENGLREALERAREALQPFAAMADEMERVAEQHAVHASKIGRTHNYEHCVAARSALQHNTGERDDG